MSRINQILNVSTQEWPRILVAWSMTFLTRFGFIVGWSILIATFLSKVGVDLLPILFLSNAVLVMLGTLLFKPIIHRIRREYLITFTIFTAVIFLLSSIFFLSSNSFIFFTLLLIAESVLLAQLSIFLSLFNEEIFSPLESQRTFPIIESAETIGGIAGGLTLGIFANTLPAYKFIIIWALALLLILPIVLRYNPRTMEVPSLEKKKSPKRKFGEGFKELKKIPFLRGLMVVVLFHWAIMNVIEFQYTKAIQQEVYTLITASGESHLASQLYEQEIAQRLGALHTIFNTAALMIQLLLASRIITSIGIISSLLVHPIVTLLNLVGLSLRFSFFTAVLTRGSYELTSLIFKNSYDSSYYAVPSEQRDDVKEWMQGIMKPLGAILGTFLILLIAFKTQGTQQTLFLNLVLVLMAIIMSVFIFRLNRKYTEMSEQNLSRKANLGTRLNAVEILAQHGHKKSSTAALQKLLGRKNEPEILKRKILKTLAEQHDPEAISSLLEVLKDENDRLRLGAARALKRFQELEGDLNRQSFTRYRIIEHLKAVLEEEKNENIKEVLIDVFHKLAPQELTEFLMQSIKENKVKRASFIRMLKLFPDPNVKYYLQDYLKSKSPEIKGASISALWQFKELRTELEHHLRQMLKSKKISTLKVGLKVCGELNLEELKPSVKKHLKSENEAVQKTALLALAQMEDPKSIPHLVKAFTDPQHKWFEKSYSILGTLPIRFRDRLIQHIHSHITQQIHNMLKGKNGIEDLAKTQLKELKALYHKINAHEEAHKVQTLLDSSD